jgi:hypothetical protein
MYCDQTESDLKADGSAEQAARVLKYYGYASISVRGPVSGQLYQFSRQQPVQPVDARDAASILKTRLFRPTR